LSGSVALSLHDARPIYWWGNAVRSNREASVKFWKDEGLQAAAGIRFQRWERYLLSSSGSYTEYENRPVNFDRPVLYHCSSSSILITCSPSMSFFKLWSLSFPSGFLSISS